MYTAASGAGISPQQEEEEEEGGGRVEMEN